MNKVQLLNKYYYYNEPNLHEGYHAVVCTLLVGKKLANPIQCACVSVLSRSAMFYPLQPHGL